MREQILKQFDKDGDGKLSDEEKTAAMKDRGGRPGGPGAGGPGAGGRPGGGPGGAGMAEIIKKFDKDGNGKLSEEERQAARAGMAKGGRPGGHPAAGGAPGQRRRPDGAGAKKPE